ncbi:related to tuftelin-interacting protein 11 [Cephalotrichum gorgonifer]|uniref:Related to tuftelin-interacting protein 11 n=1 Tax=Cephalotrichum gorgonifer TaxID=2041049 RepID=A0AAE8SY14_9PEZI|nr:related to tuftelin-interacting protein 11 [Cephalotrichum gorgonifer]
MDGAPHITFKQANAAAYSSSDESSADEYVLPNEERDEYRPRKRRRTGRDPKESAALGVFGSESEDDGPGKRWKAKTLRGKRMSFVGAADTAKVADEYSDSDEEEGKGGGMDVDEKDASEDDDDEEEDVFRPSFAAPAFHRSPSSAEKEEEEDEEEEAPTFRPSFAAPAFHKGPSLNQQSEEQTPTRKPSSKPRFDSSLPFGRGFVSASANEPVLRSDLEDTPPPRKAMPSAFNTNGKKNPMSFGAKMMAKMGYQEGKGLGKEGQGRNIVIEANLRPQGAGLGAVREKSEQERKEEKRQAKLRGEVVSDSEEEARKKKLKNKLKGKVGSGLDSASPASTPKRQKQRYMTAEEIKKTAPGLHIPDAFMPILDMTGPDSKMVAASGLGTPSSAPESAETVATRKILCHAHRDLSAFSEEWKNLTERGAWVDTQLSEFEQEMENLTLDYQRLMDFSDVVTNELPAAGTDWQSVITCLHKAATLGPQTPETAALIVAALEPFFKDPEWDPLKEPTRYAADMKGLEGLLMPDAEAAHSVEKFDSSMFNGDGIYRHHHRSTTPYESLMYRLWLPRALRATRDCDVYDPTQLMSILEAWDPLLPPFIRVELLDNIVRRLHNTLVEWNPKRRRKEREVLPHIWLFPWLPYLPPHHLDPKGSGLVADVRRKFRQLIEAWDFSRGLVPGLAKWKDVLGREWRGLMLASVLPSMGRYLGLHFRVDPADQEPYLAALEGVLSWREVLGEKYVAEVVRGKVFPMWHAKLEEWFALGADADLGEIAGWFEWWDGYFPGRIGALVRGEFERGLLAIERSLDRVA